MQHKKHNCTFRFLVLTGIAIVILFSISSAMPPHPEMVEQAAKENKALPYFIVNLDEMHSKGICTGDETFEHIYQSAKDAVNEKSLVTGQFNVLALLVDFSDQTSGEQATTFDSLIFDSNGYTVNDYYDEISYGQLDIVTVNLPSSVGWTRAPQTYSYYANNQNGTGSYPTNSQKLVEDLVNAVDGSVDFSNYDNDNDNFVDVLVIIHSGQGAEVTGLSSDIWSHKWGISPKLTNDGVYVSSYTIQPEFITSMGDMTIGVFAHELAHGFGLPDLYDIDGSSQGIGRWGIMSYGSWSGPSGKGGRPTGPSAWSRIQMGFTTETNITANIDSQQIQDVKIAGDIYRLWTSGNIGSEYFLIENRQRTGYDTYLPGAGLLIWHIDEAASDNSKEWYPGQPDAQHYKVALEQADGLYELEHQNDNGDGNDIFPGGLNIVDFNALSSTTSNSYQNGISFVSVEDIVSNSGIISADLKVGFAAAIEDDQPNDILPVNYSLRQNYPNPFNPETQIEFYTASSGHATIDIFNIVGKKINTIIDEQINSGSITVSWDGHNSNGQEAASGVYFYRLSINNNVETKKMTLIR